MQTISVSRSGAVLIVVLLIPSLLHAQDTGAPPEPDWPVDPATHPRPTHPATRASGPIRIDGVVDEAAWDESPSITRFIQSQPDLGHPATERTDIRILYDDDALYVACICYDSQPNHLTITSLDRDFSAPNADVVSFVVDPNLDRRNGFLFTVNPYGAVGDGQIFDDHRILNYAWDGVVQVESRVTDFGWTFEMAIPWTTLRFEGSEESQSWGFNVLRRVRRINEVAYWSPLQRHEFIPKVSRAGTLTRLEGLEQGRNLRIKPYVRGSFTSGTGATTGLGDELDAGGDLKYGVTSNLTLDATYRTDFSHVEVDEVQMNLTRFPLFFPERREFFIENSGIFEFGDDTQREYRMGVSGRDFTLFHTRRIGLTPAGDRIPILAGARLSGTMDEFELGALGMRTKAAGGRPEENFGVLRLRRRLLGESNVGLMVTHRNLVSEDGSPTHNRAYGADASFTFAEHLLLTSYVVGVEAPDLEGGTLDRSGLRLSAGWRDRFWNASALYRRFGDDFAPALGFVRRRGMHHAYATIGVHPSVDRFSLQEINPYFEIDRFTNLEAVLETRSARAGLGLSFDDGSRSNVTYERLYERILEPFPVSSSDLTVGTGEYETQQVGVTHSTSPARVVSGEVSLSHGGYFDGSRTTYGIGGAWRLNAHVALDLTLERNEIELPAGGLVADLAQLRLSANPSTRFLTSAYVQYNGLTEEVVSNVRLRFVHAPLSDLYLVFSERRDVAGDSEPEQSLSLKVTRLFGF